MGEQKKHNEHITTYLDWYLDLENPEFAFMVKGDWGTGKSFFIKEYQKEKHNAYKFVNISLNGVSNIEEISKQFLASYFPALNNKYSNIIFNLVAGTANHFGYNSLLAKLKYRDFIDSLNYNKEKKCIIVFDDFERHCFKSHQTAMGFINTFIEKNKLNVIIVSNEDDINKEKNNKYDLIKEKVIGQTLTIDTPVKYVFDLILEDLSKNEKTRKAIEVIKNYYDVVFEIIEKSECRNFRVIRQTIQNFSRLAELVDLKYLKNETFTGRLIIIFFAFEIEHRIGKLNAKIFDEIRGGGYIFAVEGKDDRYKTKVTNEMREAWEILKKYNFSTLYDTFVFDTATWRKWLFEGNISKDIIFKNIESSNYFNKETNISKIVDWIDLSDDEFNQVIKEIINKIKNQELRNSSDIFLVYNRFLYFGKHGYDFSELSTGDINNVFLDYINEISKKGLLEEDYNFLHQDYSPQGNVDKYNNVKSSLLLAIQKASMKDDEVRANKVLSIMKTDPKKAGNMICKIIDEDTEQPKKLFEFIDSNEFVDRYNDIDNKDKRIICYKIKDRFRIIHHNEWLLDEKEFIEKSIEYIQERIEKEAYSPSVFNLEQLKIALEKGIEIMEAYEKNK